MYENQMKGIQVSATGQDRPSGSIRSQVEHLWQILESFEAQQRRMQSLLAKLLSPRPEPDPTKDTGRVEPGQPSIEARLQSIVAYAERLQNGFSEIADRLDSAV